MKNLKILVVDDAAGVRSALRAILKRLGQTNVALAGSVEETRLIVASSVLPFDLVFMDLQLPNGGYGLDVARELRAINSSLPIYLMSAALFAPEEHGMTGFLEKPFDFEIIESIVNQWAKE